MSSKLWGGRFSKEVDASITGWTESVTIDSKMVVEDIWGSMAHVAMLGVKGIIPPKDAAAILSKLLEFQDGYVAGSWQLQLEREDVHMNVEARLIDALSIAIGGKMHTGRSRNDQVVLDSKLYTRRRLLELRERLLPVIETLLERAGGMTEDVMSSYTHVQHAQPISVAYWLSHYAAVFLRDLDRLKRAYDLTDENPLGSGAIAGTSFPIDRELTKDLFIETTVQPLLKDFPALKLVMEHITTEEAVDFIGSDTSGRLAATVTPQHLMFNRNALFTGGLRPHQYCLPVLKRERHRLALRHFATSGSPKVFLGTDSAPHLRRLKEATCGCAGIFNAPVALQSYLTVFDEEKALDKFEAFASIHGARFYGLPLNGSTLTLRRVSCEVSEDIALPGGGSIHPFLGGSTLPWMLEEERIRFAERPPPGTTQCRWG
jgi:hypothetical protein